MQLRARAGAHSVGCPVMSVTTTYAQGTTILIYKRRCWDCRNPRSYVRNTHTTLCMVLLVWGDVLEAQATSLSPFFFFFFFFFLQAPCWFCLLYLHIHRWTVSFTNNPLAGKAFSEGHSWQNQTRQPEVTINTSWFCSAVEACLPALPHLFSLPHTSSLPVNTLAYLC